MLYDILLSLEKSELRRISKMVRSPFFTHRIDLGRMFLHLAQCRYKSNPLPDKDTLFNITYPDMPYDDQVLRAAMSDLRQIIEQFLVFQPLESDPIRSKMVLAATYRERNLDKLFHQTTAKIQSALEAQAHRNADFMQLQLEYHVETANFLSRTVRTEQLPLQVISDAIDTLYLAQKLRHACTQLSHQAVYKTQYEFGMLPAIIDTLESSPYLAHPAISLYYYCYRFMSEAYSMDYFQKFRDELARSSALFPDHELKDLYLYGINFCIRKLNEGHESFILDGWNMYQEGLQKGFLLENSRLSAFAFNNVVALGIKLQLFAEVERFILEYRQYLEPSQQTSYVQLNMARLEFTRGNLDAALGHLQTADFKDLVNNLIAKTLLLKIYYLLEEFDLLDSHLDNFRSFIRRREVSDYHRKNYTNIIQLVRKILAMPPGNSAARKALLNEIAGMKVLSEKEWLLHIAEKA